MKPFIVRKKRSGQIIQLFCGVMFLVFFIFLLSSEETLEEFRGFFKFVGWIGVVLSALNLLMKIYHLIYPRALIIATGEGLWDYSSPDSLGFIPWEEIETIKHISLHGERFVGVRIPRIRRILEDGGQRYTANQRNRVKTHLSLSYPPMLIQLKASGQDPAGIAEFLAEYRIESLAERQNAGLPAPSVEEYGAKGFQQELMHILRKG